MDFTGYGEVSRETRVRAVLDRSGGVPCGQVTSARRSPKLGQVIGMAWVPAGSAQDGTHIVISDDGEILTNAHVVTDAEAADLTAYTAHGTGYGGNLT